MKLGAINAKVPMLVTAWPTMIARDRRLVEKMHLHYEREFARLAQANPDNLEAVAAGIHDGIDRWVIDKIASHPRGPEVACRKGCSHCCHIHVSITQPEALLLLKLAEHAGIALDRAKMARQAATMQDPEAWHRMPLADRACVFLDPAAGTCRVYEHRPDACRKYHVIGDPERCDADQHWGAKVLNFVSIEAEVAASAALNVFEWGGLAAMLLKYTKEKPE